MNFEPIEIYQGIAFVLALLASVYYGQARYWKGVAKTLDEERDETGWQNEAKFWRLHFNREVAELVEDRNL